MTTQEVFNKLVENAGFTGENLRDFRMRYVLSEKLRPAVGMYTKPGNERAIPGVYSLIWTPAGVYHGSLEMPGKRGYFGVLSPQMGETRYNRAEVA